MSSSAGVSLVCRPTVHRRTARGELFFNFEDGGAPFPAADWEDFVGPILSAWLQSLARSNPVGEKLRFMDTGDMAVVGEGHIWLFSSHSRARMVPLSLRRLRELLLEAFEVMDDAYRRHQWPVDRDWEAARHAAAEVAAYVV